MAKAIRSYPKTQKVNVVARRITSVTKGLGYWASVDAQDKALRDALIAKGLIKPAGK